MKCFLLGLVMMTSIFPLVMAQVEQDVTLARDFTWSLVGGAAGSMMCMLCFPTNTLRQQVRDTGGNILIATTFGPTVCYVVSSNIGVAMSYNLIITVSAILGMSGVSLVRVMGPKIFHGFVKAVPAVEEALPEMLLRHFGYEKKKPDTK